MTGSSRTAASANWWWGERASLSHTVTRRDVDLFALATGDVNPAHVDPVYAASRQITGAPLDGPLAFDTAINAAAATEKGIVSEVAG